MAPDIKKGITLNLYNSLFKNFATKLKQKDVAPSHVFNELMKTKNQDLVDELLKRMQK